MSRPTKPETKQHLSLIKEAWNTTKGKEDPLFDACHVDHQLALIYRAEDVIQNGPHVGTFEVAFHNLLNGKPALALPETMSSSATEPIPAPVPDVVETVEPFQPEPEKAERKPIAKTAGPLQAKDAKKTKTEK